MMGGRGGRERKERGRLFSVHAEGLSINGQARTREEATDGDKEAGTGTAV